jgi:nitroimidazol reductase NimA-like FMN-containing flavoprotein (pyridoxamine 5'-phosphate oxidase superfamily)
MGEHETLVWVDDLDVDVCWRLMGREFVGRVGFVEDGEPWVLPVNHCVVDSTIVFRTGGETSLHSLAPDVQVAFEVDGSDGTAETGWSVLVKGHLSEVTDAAERARLGELMVHPWAPGPKDHWMQIVPTQTTGRSISRRRAHPEGELLPYMPLG